MYFTFQYKFMIHFILNTIHSKMHIQVFINGKHFNKQLFSIPLICYPAF